MAQQVPGSGRCLVSSCGDRDDAGGMNMTRLETLSRRSVGVRYANISIDALLTDCRGSALRYTVLPRVVISA